jgi:hypothetical protein
MISVTTTADEMPVLRPGATSPRIPTSASGSSLAELASELHSARKSATLREQRRQGLNYAVPSGDDKMMREQGTGKHQARVRQEEPYQGAATTNTGLGSGAGRTAYREEYQRDYGPDLDESLDGTESGYQF